MIKCYGVPLALTALFGPGRLKVHLYSHKSVLCLYIYSVYSSITAGYLVHISKSNTGFKGCKVLWNRPCIPGVDLSLSF